MLEGLSLYKKIVLFNILHFFGFFILIPLGRAVDVPELLSFTSISFYLFILYFAIYYSVKYINSGVKKPWIAIVCLLIVLHLLTVFVANY